MILLLKPFSISPKRVGKLEKEREKERERGGDWGGEGIVEVGFVIESEEPRLSKLGPAARRDRERRTK